MREKFRKLKLSCAVKPSAKGFKIKDDDFFEDDQDSSPEHGFENAEGELEEIGKAFKKLPEELRFNWDLCDPNTGMSNQYEVY